MENVIIEIIYLSLTGIVASTIAILVPLTGAFWIFKVRENSVAEGKIFELGREIANILQSKNIIGPIEGTSYVYVENARHKIEEKNHEEALKKLLRNNLYYFKPGEDLTEDEEKETANIVVAIATQRIQSLVPPTVNWSGKGFAYSIYGEEIAIRDSYFPFGTKLYRQWIERFGSIYNDLWAITTSRHQFVDNFLKGYKNSQLGIDEKFVNNWLDEISSRIKKIHPIHAKLMTQVQIIDTQIDLPRLGKDVGLVSFYGLLLAITGFFAPKIIYLAGLASLSTFIYLATAVPLRRNKKA